MKLATRLLLIPSGLLLAVLSFAHAASLTNRVAFPPGFFGRLWIDSHMVGKLVDRLFVAEMTALETRTLEEQRLLSAEELASLVENPVALKRLMEERQRPKGAGTGNEYPTISGDLLRLARLSYASDPLNVRTLRTIALGHVVHQDQERARQLMRLAARISKRDDVTNLWLAQDYGQHGNIEQMLASFDHALRTSRRARERAIGPVVGLLASHESHEMLGDLLRKQPDWQDTFWAEFSRNSNALANAAAFFANSGVPLDQISEVRRQSLYTNLKRLGLYGTLFALAEIDPTVRGSNMDSQARAFGAGNEPNSLGWTFHSRGTFSTSAHRSSNELQIDAQAGAFGLAAEQLMRGARDLQMILQMAEPVPDGALVRLSATCMDGQKRELAAVALSPGETEGAVTVPARECHFVNVQLSFEVKQGRQSRLIRIADIQSTEL